MPGAGGLALLVVWISILSIDEVSWGLTITVPPDVELVACLKISIKGNPVGVESALSRLPRQKRTAISMPRPRKPFMITDAHMLRGIMIAAFSISSAFSHPIIRTVSGKSAQNGSRRGHMEQGRFDLPMWLAASIPAIYLISSARWFDSEHSIPRHVPMKEKILVANPTKNDRPVVLQPPPLLKVAKTSAGFPWGAK